VVAETSGFGEEVEVAQSKSQSDILMQLDRGVFTFVVLSALLDGDVALVFTRDRELDVILVGSNDDCKKEKKRLEIYLNYGGKSIFFFLPVSPKVLRLRTMRWNKPAGILTIALYSVSGMPRCSLSMSKSFNSKSETISAK